MDPAAAPEPLPQLRAAPRPSETSAAEAAPRGASCNCAGDLSHAEVASVAYLATGLLEPMARAMLAQSEFRNSMTELNGAQMRTSLSRAERQQDLRAQQLKRARELAEEASSGLPSWARTLIGAVLTAVGTVAAAFTGGASIPLLVIGVILISAGEVVGHLAEQGVIDPTKGGIAAVVLKIAGAIVMAVATAGAGAANAGGAVGSAASAGATSAGAAGASAGAGAASAGASVGAGAASAASAGTQTATLATQIVQQVVRDLETTYNITTSARDIHTGVLGYQSEQERLDAEESEVRREAALDDIDVAGEAITAVMRRYQRIAERANEVMAARGEAQLAALRNFA